MARYQVVAPDEFDLTFADELTMWRRDGVWIRCGLVASDFSAAGELARRIASIADEMDHHPDIDIRYPATVSVSTTTHDMGGLTMHDIELARRISALSPI